MSNSGFESCAVEIRIRIIVRQKEVVRTWCVVEHLKDTPFVQLELAGLIRSRDLTRRKVELFLCGCRMVVLEHGVARIWPLPVRIRRPRVDSPRLELAAARARRVRIRVRAQAGDGGEVRREAAEAAIVVARVVAQPLQRRAEVLVADREAALEGLEDPSEFGGVQSVYCGIRVKSVTRVHMRDESPLGEGSGILPTAGPASSCPNGELSSP
jgi:hypothetical protein